jgi:hypothetical protein
VRNPVMANGWIVTIFKLQTDGDDISNAELIEASKTNIDLELHLENWLEKSP